MEFLRVERSGGVVTVVMSRPEKKNAVNLAMWRELAGAITAIERLHTDRVMVLTGDGGDFCSGADLIAKLLWALMTDSAVRLKQGTPYFATSQITFANLSSEIAASAFA